MPAAKYDLLIEQGTTWSLTLTLKKPNKLPVDLTGYSAICQIRKSPPQEPELIVQPVTQIMNPPENGQINFSIDASITSALDFKSAIHDIVLKSADNKVVRVLQGVVKLSPRVTIWGSGYSGFSGYSGYSGV